MGLRRRGVTGPITRVHICIPDIFRWQVSLDSSQPGLHSGKAEAMRVQKGLAVRIIAPMQFADREMVLYSMAGPLPQ